MHLSAGVSRVYVRQAAFGEGHYQKTDNAYGKGAGEKQSFQKCKAEDI